MCDVGLDEARERPVRRRRAPRDADELVPGGIAGERRHEGGADVARGAGDDDPHREVVPVRPGGQTACDDAAGVRRRMHGTGLPNSGSDPELGT